MIYQTPGLSRSIYKGGISNPGDTGRPTKCSSRQKKGNNFTKGEHFLKTKNWADEKHASHRRTNKGGGSVSPLSSRRAALAIAKEKMHTV